MRGDSDLRLEASRPHIGDTAHLKHGCNPVAD